MHLGYRVVAVVESTMHKLSTATPWAAIATSCCCCCCCCFNSVPWYLLYLLCHPIFCVSAIQQVLQFGHDLLCCIAAQALCGGVDAGAESLHKQAHQRVGVVTKDLKGVTGDLKSMEVTLGRMVGQQLVKHSDQQFGVVDCACQQCSAGRACKPTAM